MTPDSSLEGTPAGCGPCHGVSRRGTRRRETPSWEPLPETVNESPGVLDGYDPPARRCSVRSDAEFGHGLGSSSVEKRSWLGGHTFLPRGSRSRGGNRRRLRTARRQGLLCALRARRHVRVPHHGAAPEQPSRVRAEWAKWEKEDAFRVRSCKSTDQRVQAFGDVAVFTHSVQTELSTKGGPSTVRERETIVFQRRDGKWIAVHEHLSPYPEPTPPAKK